jgi:hypothetical protein
VLAALSIPAAGVLVATSYPASGAPAKTAPTFSLSCDGTLHTADLTWTNLPGTARELTLSWQNIPAGTSGSLDSGVGAVAASTPGMELQDSVLDADAFITATWQWKDKQGATQIHQEFVRCT